MNIKTSVVISSFLLAVVPGIIAEDSCKTVKEIVCGKNDLSRFCDLISDTATDDVFDGEDLTVFAPSNKAVKSMKFLKDLEDEDLEEVVLFHVHSGKLRTSQMVCRDTLSMLSGKDSRTVCQDSEPTFQKGGGNDRERMPELTSTNIAASNGVVHIVNTVMLPGGFQTYEANGRSSSKRIQHSGWFVLALALAFMYL